MARNPDRRDRLTDAGLRVIARDGARGLTHRAVDREADVPLGTTSNYFRTREALLAALGERIIARLSPDPAVLADLDARPPTRERFVAHMRDILDRTLGAPDLMRALLELRLEATRVPALRDALRETLAASYRADLRYQAASGLPGGDLEVELMRYAMDGLILDRVTVSIGADSTTDEAVARLVERLIPAGTGGDR